MVEFLLILVLNDFTVFLQIDGDGVVSSALGLGIAKLLHLELETHFIIAAHAATTQVSHELFSVPLRKDV